MNNGAVTITRLLVGYLGLVLVSNPLPVFGGDQAATSRHVDVEVGRISVSAIGHSAKANTNIGGLTDSSTSGSDNPIGRVRVRCGHIERIAVGENASASVSLPGSRDRCSEEYINLRE